MSLRERGETGLGRRDLVLGSLVAIALVAASALFVSSQLGFRHKARQVLEWDHVFYIAMARPAEQRGGLEEARVVPFCYRVLTPIVVERLTAAGLHLHTAYYLVTNLSLVGFLVSFYFLLRLRRLAPAEAALGTALVGLLQGAVRWYEYQYWMTDPLSLWLLVLAFVAVELERDATLVTLCVLGALARESVVIALVYAVLRRFEARGLAPAARLAVVLWPAPLAVLAALRYAILPAEPPQALSGIVRQVLADRSADLGNQLYLVTLGAFGVFVPLLWLSPRRLLRRLPRRPSSLSVVVIAGASLALGNNTDRLLAYALPAIVPFALLQLRSLSEASAVRWSVLAALLLALQAQLYWLTPLLGVRHVSTQQPTLIPVVIGMAAFYVAAWLLPRRAGSV